MLQQSICPSRLPLANFPRRERLEGSPGVPNSRNTTQNGAFRAGSLVGNPLAATLPNAADRICPGLRTRAGQGLAYGL